MSKKKFRLLKPFGTLSVMGAALPWLIIFLVALYLFWDAPVQSFPVGKLLVASLFWSIVGFVIANRFER